MEHRQQEPRHAPPVHTIPSLRWSAGKLHKMEALLQWADQSADQNWGHCLAVSTHTGKENSGPNWGPHLLGIHRWSALGGHGRRTGELHCAEGLRAVTSRSPAATAVPCTPVTRPAAHRPRDRNFSASSSSCNINKASNASGGCGQHAAAGGTQHLGTATENVSRLTVSIAAQVCCPP